MLSPPRDFPPSTKRVWPVIKVVEDAAKKAIALAISAGLAALPEGSIASQALNISAGADRVIGVSGNPGATELPAIRASRSSIAIARVSPMTADFDAT